MARPTRSASSTRSLTSADAGAARRAPRGRSALARAAAVAVGGNLSALALAACLGPLSGPSSVRGCAPPATEEGPADPATARGGVRGGDGAKPTYATPPTAVTTHPRLFVRQADLPRLRAWASADNPVYQDGLRPLAEECRAAADRPELARDDRGAANAYVERPTEALAMLFAFMSLVSPSAPERADYARRARQLLMRVIDAAVKGPEPGAPFRDPEFGIGDRSRWHGASFPLAVDWIYDSLTADDKRKIRAVFLRWASDRQRSEYTTSNHPEPIGVLDDRALVADQRRTRWAANNYYTAHARNIGLSALAFDAADDPNDELRSRLPIATGSWLYVFDALSRGDMRGGLGAEGFEYSPQANGYVAQLLLALFTAGRADPRSYGRQATFDNPFWDDSVSALLHSIGPAPATGSSGEARFPVAWYGDGQTSWAPDFIGVFGPLGLYDAHAGNAERLSRIRWIETFVPPGGASQREERVRGDRTLDSVFYFLLFDPKAPAPRDPRPALPLQHFAEGMGRHLARTSWKPDATWFTYKLGWATIDHQHADGNGFELWRKGEWLVKERTGYGDDIACSDQKNTIAIENDPPAHGDGYRGIEWRRGSQWTYVPDGDGKILASHRGPDFTYFLGDATALHNSKVEGSTSVAHVSRSIVWLPADRVITYDRVAAKVEGRFKRFHLQLPAPATVTGRLTAMRTSGGQQLFVRTLLPEGASVTVTPAEALSSDGDKQPADDDPIRFRLRVEAPAGPRAARFLHVLEGADAGAPPTEAIHVRARAGAFEGVSTGGVVVMFPIELGAATDALSFSAPAGAKAFLVTGLAADNGYAVKIAPGPGSVTVTIERGGDKKTDAGGTLLVGKLP